MMMMMMMMMNLPCLRAKLENITAILIGFVVVVTNSLGAVINQQTSLGGSTLQTSQGKGTHVKLVFEAPIRECHGTSIADL